MPHLPHWPADASAAVPQLAQVFIEMMGFGMALAQGV
jgi:hypothetical protein